MGLVGNHGYADDLDVFSLHRYRLAPSVFERTGAVAVFALLAVPLAGLAARARWAALVLGGSLAVFALTLPAFVFPHFADAVSLSQARRFAGFVPLPFAFAGGLALLARWTGVALLPAALAAGIALELERPGSQHEAWARANAQGAVDGRFDAVLVGHHDS